MNSNLLETENNFVFCRRTRLFSMLYALAVKYPTSTNLVIFGILAFLHSCIDDSNHYGHFISDDYTPHIDYVLLAVII